jgi:hypothetical protein
MRKELFMVLSLDVIKVQSNCFDFIEKEKTSVFSQYSFSVAFKIPSFHYLNKFNIFEILVFVLTKQIEKI